MDIRILRREDAEQYWSLRLTALKESPAQFQMTYDEEAQRENPLAEVAERLERNDRFTFGAFSDGRLMAVATLELATPVKIRHKGNVLAMYVAVEQRGKGLAKQLFHTVIEKAREQDLEQLQLSVLEENVAALRLYESIGFHIYGIEEQAFKWENRYSDECHMVMFL